jgi:hypothetical protein
LFSRTSTFVGFQDSENCLQAATQALGHFPRAQLSRSVSAPPSPESLHAGDGVSFVIEHTLDLKDRFNISLDIEALLTAAFLGLEKAELGFPESQNVRRELRELTDFSDFVKDLAAQPGLNRHHRPSCLLGETLAVFRND